MIQLNVTIRFAGYSALFCQHFAASFQSRLTRQLVHVTVSDFVQKVCDYEVKNCRRFLRARCPSCYPTSIISCSWLAVVSFCQDWKKIMFFRKSFQVFRFFLVFKGFFRFFRFQCPDTKFPPRKLILYTILSGRAFSVKYNKTHKSRLKYEI